MSAPGWNRGRTGRSIGVRLTILLAAIAALLAFLAWSMVTGFAREAAQRTQDSVLAASAATIAEALRAEGGEIRLELPYAAFAMLAALGEDRVFYRIVADGQTLTGYDDLTPPDEVARPGAAALATYRYRGESVRVAAVTRTVLAGQAPVPVTVIVAQTRNGVLAITSGLSRTAAALSVGLFVLAVVLGAVAARTSLSPLNEIAQAVARRGPSDLRPVRREVPSELYPLIGALNRLMDRLSAAIRQSEDFIAEAAHRVRTPLATLRAEAELALHASGSEAERAGLRRMLRAVDESARSASQLLDHATVTFRADALERAPIELPDLMERVATALTPLAELRDIDIITTTRPGRVQGDAIMLESALRNLLDNAIKYAPPDSVVHLSNHDEHGDHAIVVTDSGPGFQGQDTARLQERFQRGQGAQSIIGSGLGLTIAAAAAQAHGGRITLSERPEGGACVSLVLPRG